MNIFVLDIDPVIAAQSQCDKHVVKMILESAQLLSSVHHLTNSIPGLYKLTHKNHPCSIWARTSISNYKWLCSHALGLCNEYTFRYNKIHASQKIIELCANNIPEIPEVGLSKFALAMPEEYKTDDPVLSYRNYYIKDKAKNIKINFTKRDVPKWFIL